MELFQESSKLEGIYIYKKIIDIYLSMLLSEKKFLVSRNLLKFYIEFIEIFGKKYNFYDSFSIFAQFL